MPQEILAVAIFDLVPGEEQAALATLRELVAALKAGGYSRDFLYRDARTSEYVLLRYWKSEEARRAAQEDPVVQRCWAKLGHEIHILKVYEQLEDVGL